MKEQGDPINEAGDVVGITDNNEEFQAEEIDVPSDDDNAEPIEYSIAKFEQFCSTRLELDKSLLTLSTAGLGFSATYLMSDKVSSYYVFSLLSLGSLFFGVSIATVLVIFKKNACYLLAGNDEAAKLEKLLTKLDFVARSGFGLAIAFVVTAALIISHTQLTDKLNTELSGKDAGVINEPTEPTEPTEGRTYGKQPLWSQSLTSKGTVSAAESNQNSEQEIGNSQDDRKQETDAGTNNKQNLRKRQLAGSAPTTETTATEDLTESGKEKIED